MAISVSGIAPVAHLPLILGVLRKLEVAALIDDLLPPHPDNVISCGRGVEVLVWAILDSDRVLYKVGARLEERGMLPLLQAGLQRESLNDYRLGQMLEGLLAANLNRVFGAVALKALEVIASRPPGCIKIRPRSRSMGRMRPAKPAVRQRRTRAMLRSCHARPMAIARIDVPTSSRCCSVSR